MAVIAFREVWRLILAIDLHNFLFLCRWVATAAA
jgi:hypothetical protein